MNIEYYKSLNYIRVHESMRVSHTNSTHDLRNYTNT